MVSIALCAGGSKTRGNGNEKRADVLCGAINLRNFHLALIVSGDV